MKIILFFSLIFINTIDSSFGQIITTIAGNGTWGFSGEGGPATNAQFNFLAGVTADKSGNIYIADQTNGVVQKIDSNGILTRFAGSGVFGYGGDGGPATNAELETYFFMGLAVDSSGNVYIGCGGTVRKVNASGIISRVAGTGAFGYSGDGGPAAAAELSVVTGLCFDKTGNLYISDEQNSVIRMVDTSGIISTIVGTSFGFSGDGGPATAAQLKTPAGIAFDDSGNLYICDYNTLRLRKVNTAGIITSIAGGNPADIGCCPGCAATSINLGATGIAIDHSGNIYVSDIGHAVVQKITKDGIVQNFAGNCVDGFTGDGGPAVSAELHRPNMICFDNKGNLLIADKGNDRLRKVWISTTFINPTLTVEPASLIIYSNPVVQKNLTFSIKSKVNEAAEIRVSDLLGRILIASPCLTNEIRSIALPIQSGMYFVSVITSSTVKLTAKIVVE